MCLAAQLKQVYDSADMMLLRCGELRSLCDDARISMLGRLLRRVHSMRTILANYVTSTDEKLSARLLQCGSAELPRLEV